MSDEEVPYNSFEERYDKAVRLPANDCWNCHTILDAMSPTAGDHKPRAGSISICAYCGALGIVETDELSTHVRKPTEQEHRDLLADKTVQGALAMWRSQWVGKGNYGRHVTD